jgi:hypothetical protein
MRSKVVSVRMPWPLYEWNLGRARTMRPVPYKNVGRYLLGMNIHDILVQRDHTLTVEVANAGMDEQDREIKNLLDASQKGELSGSWLRHLIEECIQEADSKVSPDEVESRLAKKIKARLLEGKLGKK